MNAGFGTYNTSRLWGKAHSSLPPEHLNPGHSMGRGLTLSNTQDAYDPAMEAPDAGKRHWLNSGLLGSPSSNSSGAEG